MHRLAVPALLALLLVTGCTSSSESATASGGGGDAGSEDAAAPAAGRAAVPAVAQAPLQGRSVVRTAELQVRVDDVRAAADRARALTVGAGGALAGEDASEGRASLQLRVPPARLDDLLGRLADLGQEVSRTVGSEDVTEQVVDLDSRLATQRASVARVRALLDRATGLGDVVKIEGELARREAELESLDARARALGDRVDLSTVVLQLEQDDEAGAAAAAPRGFTGGLDAGWTALTTTARVLAAVLGAVLPFLPLVLLAGLAVRWSRRRAA